MAVVGSVMASVYGTHVLGSMTSLGAPATAAAAAQKSVVAGLAVAAHLPRPPGQRRAGGTAGVHSRASRQLAGGRRGHRRRGRRRPGVPARPRQATRSQQARGPALTRTGSLEALQTMTEPSAIPGTSHVGCSTEAAGCGR